MSTDAPEQRLFKVMFIPFAQRHFIKSFEKKYKRNWDITLEALKVQYAHIESLVRNNRVPAPIHVSPDNQHWVLKHSFSVAGYDTSPRTSGNRSILVVDRITLSVYVLLVYHKTDLKDVDETAQWHALIKSNCKEYLEGFSL